ncbi:MAG: CMP-binding protein [Planctomycetaceae bacterium]|nr:CMP-binding protein [Planctomycetaceae bacterium]MCH2595558.1 HD domain-containing protein [Pirellulales bacterium]HCK42673.1 CMP-binding protein [Planctomycetaceae bacterium]|tara:strand:+ start:27 stop:1001 length:975 start_codon:yes stop_codon:yes gene_type:complete
MPNDSRRYVSQLAHNETVSQVFLASDKQLRPNRNGNLYLQVDLADRSGSVNARMWNASDNDYRTFENGDYVHVEGATQLFQGNMQLIANRIRKARPDEIEESDFVTLQSEEVDLMRDRLISILNGIKSAPLSRLAKGFLSDDELMTKFCKAPAGMKNHHAYQGGLLEHVLSLMELLLVVSPRYPQLDGDKLLMGAFLHDLAKVDELSYERDIAYTDQGQLLGHMVMGVTMLDNMVRKIVQQEGQPFPDRLLMELKHLIISHHGKYEYGSSKLPMTLEAITLHQLDNLDAKIANFTQLMTDCPNTDSNWTQYYSQIGRKLFKPEK